MCSKNNMKIFLLSLLDQIVQLRSKLAIFMETFFQGADFYKRSFHSGSFSDCDLRGCDFRYADLSNVNLSNIKAGKSWLRPSLILFISLFSYQISYAIQVTASEIHKNDVPTIDDIVFDLMFLNKTFLFFSAFLIIKVMIFPSLRSYYEDKLKNIGVEIIDESNSRKFYRELSGSIYTSIYLGSFAIAATALAISYFDTSNLIDVVKIIILNRNELAIYIVLIILFSYLLKLIHFFFISPHLESSLILFYTSFDGAKLDGVNLSESSLNKISFKKASLESADLQFSSLQNAKFINSNLKNANLENTDLTGADFTNANLEGANLTGSKLDGAHYKDGNMTYHISMMSALIIKPYSD
jgi:uncharacterized protein YjbI with pentapeptide repeats